MIYQREAIFGTNQHFFIRQKAQILEAGHLHKLPDHAPARAVRVLETAAHIDAIVTVSAGLAPIGLQSASEMQIASEAMRPLSDIVRSARLAAVTAILHSAWETY